VSRARGARAHFKFAAVTSRWQREGDLIDSEFELHSLTPDTGAISSRKRLN